MPYDVDDVLVVGISSRAFFDLENENALYDCEGLPAFRKYQLDHENEIIRPGTAFPLISALLRLNKRKRRVEVVLMSRNHPDVFLRVSNSIRHYGLDVSRSILNGGEPLERYFGSVKIDLFLSASDEDVRAAIAQGLAAGKIYRPPETVVVPDEQVRIAFDGDNVLFSDEAQKIYDDKGLEAFHVHEQERARVPLPAGPFAKLLAALSGMQSEFTDRPPFRIGLVTARNAPSHERALLTLRSWNISVDNAAFLGGLQKGPWLTAFQPHMFFDDQKINCESACSRVPTAEVLFPSLVRHTGFDTLNSPNGLSNLMSNPSTHKAKFLLVCRSYLKTGKRDDQIVEQWFNERIEGQADSVAGAIVDELQKSIAGTPKGDERPARGETNSRRDKLISFLDALMEKHIRY